MWKKLVCSETIAVQDRYEGASCVGIVAAAAVLLSSRFAPHSGLLDRWGNFAKYNNINRFSNFFHFQTQ